MAEIPFGGRRTAPEQPAQGASTLETLGTMTHWAGAAASLALVVGIGIWGYRMIVRDVSGVPVVRAASDLPMRVAPEDPGGEAARNQGLAVNRVAAVGVAEKPAERLILAPAPVALSDDDLTRGQVETAGVAAASGPAGVVQPAPQMPSIQALADHLASGTTPLGDVGAAPEELEQVVAVVPVSPGETPEPATEAETAAVVEAAAKKPVIEGGIARSLRPVLRPGGLREAVETAVAAAAASPEAAAAALLEMAPEAVPAGAKLAQLGAFDSPETARREWDKLAVKFEDYLVGKQRVIQRAQSGGRVFYRLRAVGFADMNDARRFCSALVAERADCIPVTAK